MKTKLPEDKISWHHYVPLNEVGKFLWDGWTITNCNFNSHHGAHAVIMTKVEDDANLDK